MAWTNDVIDLTTGGPGADKFLDTAVLNGANSLILTMSDGNVMTVPLAPLAGGTPVEHGGIAWNVTVPYNVGDLVTENNKTYICTVINTGNRPSLTPGQWIEANSDEFGGRAWNSGHVYMPGDIVTHIGNIYVSNTSVNAGESPITTPGKWDNPLSAVLFNEYGGMEWMPTLDYKKGTIVSAGEEAYVAKIDNINFNPIASPTRWAPVAIVTAHDRRGGLAWHTAINYDQGDMVTRGTTAYVAKTNNLAQDPTLSPADWEVVTGGGGPFTEFGGRVWDNTLDYLVGDIVSDGTTVYIAIATSTNKNPLTNPASWYAAAGSSVPVTGIRGGIEWSNAISYIRGDMVSLNGEIYVALSANTLVDPTSNPATWRHTSGERGGVEWKSTVNYLKGDTVGYNESIFIALINNNNEDPVGSPAWQVPPVDGGSF